MSTDRRENNSSNLNPEDFVNEPLPQYLCDEEEEAEPQKRFEYDRQGSYTMRITWLCRNGSVRS